MEKQPNKRIDLLFSILSGILLVVGTFFIFYRNAEAYIDFQHKVTSNLGNAFLYAFMAYDILLFAAQIVKWALQKNAFVKKIPQQAFFWLSGVNALFIGYMFLCDAGMETTRILYGRFSLALVIGLVVFFLFPRIKLSQKFWGKALALVLVVVIAVLPVLLNNQSQQESALVYDPVVYAVEDTYQIVWYTSSVASAWAEVGDTLYYDTIGGAVKASQQVHKVTVPMEQLDEAQQYTVYFQSIIERGAYSAKKGDVQSVSYEFRPVDTSDGLQIYNISDNHSSVELAAKTAGYWGTQLDLLILNGDIIESAGEEDDLQAILALAATVTKGNVPVIYVRGNHETRGLYTEQLDRYVGCVSADQYYYTTVLGGLWILVLDMAEDKADEHEEYYGLADYENYRETETRYIEQIVAEAETRFNAPEIEYRMLLSHMRVPMKYIWHEEVHKYWSLLADEMNLDLHLAGHNHDLHYFDPYEETEENYGHNYPVIVGSRPRGAEKDVPGFAGTALELREGNILLWFTDEANEIVESHPIRQ